MAFKEVFMTYYVPLCNYANKYVSDDTMSEDVVQEVFLHLWNKNNDLEVKDNLQSLLFQSVKNKALESIRSSKNYKKAIDSIPQDTQDTKKDSEQFMWREQLNSLLRHLPPKCRRVFAKHRLNGLTYAEIAAEEGISVKTVENHMTKALKILREQTLKR